MKKYKLILTILLVATIGFLFVIHSHQNQSTDAQEEILQGKIIKIEETAKQKQTINIKITKGSLKNQVVKIEEDESLYLNKRNFQQNDNLLISYDKETKQLIITDFIRSSALIWLVLIFLACVIAVAGWQGLGSLIGMLLSFIVLFKLSLPWILTGANPIMVAIISSLIIIPTTFYTAHGFNKKTTIAALSTIITLAIGGFLAWIFTNFANLTGMAAEEASFLKIATASKINFKGLLLAGMLIGAVGILDDITVAQCAVVKQLKTTNNNMSAKELYKKSMAVGKDHIASMVNTIIMIYVGASLPLLLLFFDYSAPLSDIINIEPIAEEIIRTLIGSIALILAVPIATFLAVINFNKMK